MRAARVKGWFCLPEASDDRVMGILTWEPGDGATLELIGGSSPRPQYKSMADSTDVYTDELVGDARARTVYGESPRPDTEQLATRSPHRWSRLKAANFHSEPTRCGISSRELRGDSSLFRVLAP